MWSVVETLRTWRHVSLDYWLVSEFVYWCLRKMHQPLDRNTHLQQTSFREFEDVWRSTPSGDVGQGAFASQNQFPRRNTKLIPQDIIPRAISPFSVQDIESAFASQALRPCASGTHRGKDWGTP